VRILSITGGSSIAALRRRLRTGDDLQGAAAVGAAFHVDIEDPFEQPGPTQARRRALRMSVIVCGLGIALNHYATCALPAHTWLCAFSNVLLTFTS
jgi:hypothetical protein